MLKQKQMHSLMGLTHEQVEDMMVNRSKQMKHQGRELIKKKR